MTVKFALAAAAACLALSACNSSNGSTSALTSAGAQEIDATYSEYEDRVTSGELTTTAPTGQASMSGYMGVSGINPEDSSTTVIGQLAMDVDFDAGTLTGKASDFGIYSGEVLTKEADATGTLAVDGTVGGTDMVATAAGTLSDGETPADLDLDMSGSFYDDEGALTAFGDITGTASDTGDSASSVDVDGGFYVTED